MTDRRNIIDHYKYWETEAILADLDQKRHPFSVLCSNFGNDFNIGTVIRNANAFLAKEVIIYGNKRFDRRGTVGTHLYSHLKHVKEIQDLENLKNYQMIGIDNVPNAKDLNSFKYDFSKNVLFCFGQEDIGLPKEVINLCEDLIYIPQYGSVRSLNVGTASGIIMNDFCAKLTKFHNYKM